MTADIPHSIDPRAELQRLTVQRGVSLAALSKMLGRNAAYLQQFVRRGSPRHLDETDRRMLADFFGVNDSLLGARNENHPHDNLVMVPRLETQVSAGHGQIVSSERAVTNYWFDSNWLKIAGCNDRNNLSVVMVHGDSMNPTFFDRDEILVSSSVLPKIVDGIYVLERDESVMVKRLAINPSTGLLTISSDNGAYPTWKECPLDSIRIVGKVIWVGRLIGRI